MALDDAAVIDPAVGYLYVAPADTAKPEITDPTDPGEDWENVGHTALDELPEIGRDGDDPETKGSWQNPKLRVTTPDVTYTITFRSIQASPLSYQLYFGAGPAAMQADGSFRIPAKPSAQERALLMIIVDGERFLPLYHPRVSLLGSDAVGMDADGFVTFPIRGTLLSSSVVGGGLGEWAVLGGVSGLAVAPTSAGLTVG